MKALFGVLAVVIAAGAWWLYSLSTAPPQLAFTKVTRQRLESVVTTNGKVEPLEWAAAHPNALDKLQDGLTLLKQLVIETQTEHLRSQNPELET